MRLRRRLIGRSPAARPLASNGARLMPVSSRGRGSAVDPGYVFIPRRRVAWWLFEWQRGGGRNAGVWCFSFNLRRCSACLWRAWSSWCATGQQYRGDVSDAWISAMVVSLPGQGSLPGQLRALGLWRPALCLLWYRQPGSLRSGCLGLGAGRQSGAPVLTESFRCNAVMSFA